MKEDQNTEKLHYYTTSYIIHTAFLITDFNRNFWLFGRWSSLFVITERPNCWVNEFSYTQNLRIPTTKFCVLEMFSTSASSYFWFQCEPICIIELYFLLGTKFKTTLHKTINQSDCEVHGLGKIYVGRNFLK